METEEKKHTSKQLEVINADTGYNMVLAGPGCGKTDILAERIAVAYESGKAEPTDMLCLTFTNRAARGMYDRIKKRLGVDSSELFVGNVHRYCSHFLFENDVVPAETSIMDEDDTNEVLTSEIEESDIKELIGYREEQGKYGILVSMDWPTINYVLGIDMHASGSTRMVKVETAKKVINAVRYKVMDMQHLMYQIKGEHPNDSLLHREIIELDGFKDYYPFISSLKEAFKTIKYDYRTYNGLNPVDKLIALAEKFGTYKEKNGLIDFDDLLLKTYNAYLNDIDHAYKRYKWVQIDEIQDLSKFQISLVDLFTDKSKDFVVLYLGDEQQAIYSFMGASLSTLDMLKERCINHIYHLDKNFRSPKYLLDLYNEYAIKELHVDKDFLPEPKDEMEAGFHDVCIHDYSSMLEEVDRVCNAVLPYLKKEVKTKEGIKKERTALLVPWNIDANEISDRLKKDRIPHFKISGMDSFQMVHMKTLMAHFNAVDNDFNLIAWSRILKQTHAVDTYSQGRHIIDEMRGIGMCPSDLLRDNGSTLGEFVYYFDNEEIVLFDTETTGVDVFTDDIIQIAAIKIRNGVEVPGSFKEIFLRTDKKHIPAKLGKLVNPMVEDYAQAEREGRVVERTQGLEDFMNYIGNAVLLGHNVKYDYNILKYNLKRYCGNKYDWFETPILDTLKLAHLICPRYIRYKLAYLIEHLGLEGTNSHNAKDDIMATYELAKYCRAKSDNLLVKQGDFYQRHDVQKIIEELFNGYKECYDITKARLYELCDDSAPLALVREMKELSESLSRICEFKIVDSFDLILSYIEEDVIKDEPNALKAHFDNHLMDMSTYREADLCSSSHFKENLFVSTVHKSKGLEFENVIVMRAVDQRYPHFAHVTYEQQEEDKRLFYVAISRAMKRLVVSGSSAQQFTPYLDSILHRFTVRSIIGRYLIEIGSSEMRISENGITKRRYKHIDRIFKSSNIKDQLALKQQVGWLGSQIELLENVDQFMLMYGIIPSVN